MYTTNYFHLVRSTDYEAMSRAGADFVISEVRQQPDLLLCAASGGTPTRMYAMLVEKHRADAAFFQQLRVLKLDDWGGLPMDDPATTEAYLQRHFLQPIGLPPARYFTFQSDAPDPVAECAKLQQTIGRVGPIDVCILGIGVNGHLALNEPADRLSPDPHVAQLAASTLNHPMLAHARGVIHGGLTIGIGDILRSRKILLLINGTHKAAATQRLLSGEVSTQFPASLLWLHRDVTVICDEAALQGA